MSDFAPGMKRCSKCGVVKSADLFRRHARTCKDCWGAYNRAWNATHKEERRIYQREYCKRRVADKKWLADRRLAARLWSLRNAEHNRARRRARYQECRTEQRAKKRAWYWAHRDTERARMRTYYWRRKEQKEGGNED